MATVNSVEVQNQVDKVINEKGVTDVKPLVQTFSYTAPAGIVQNDLIRLAKLEKGVRVLGGKIAWSASGGSHNIEVGTLASSARYLASTSLTSAGNANVAANIATNINDEITIDGEYLVAKVVSAAGLAAGVVLKGSVTLTN